MLLNDPQYVEAYRKLSERVLKQTADRDQQVVTMFRLATRRRPDAKELATLTKYRLSGGGAPGRQIRPTPPSC